MVLLPWKLVECFCYMDECVKFKLFIVNDITECFAICVSASED